MARNKSLEILDETYAAYKKLTEKKPYPTQGHRVPNRRRSQEASQGQRHEARRFYQHRLAEGDRSERLYRQALQEIRQRSRGRSLNRRPCPIPVSSKRTTPGLLHDNSFSLVDDHFADFCRQVKRLVYVDPPRIFLRAGEEGYQFLH